MRLTRTFGMLQFGRPWLQLVSSVLGQIAQCQWLSVTLIGLLAFAGSAAVGLINGIPEPVAHDEFSYLLAADTFAHGRLSNPPHPMWIHFENMRIIHQPTYMSIYPPAQGLILAAGQVIGGYPIVGVWMSVGLMCATVCWMLYAWVPPRWALLGGLLAITHQNLGIDGSWAQSYWGGAVAATGGALVMGSLRRIVQQPRLHNALLMGVGLAVLANSRPYEGLLISLPAGATLLHWMVNKQGPAIGISIKYIVLPILVVLSLTGTAMGLYNLRVTGDTLRMPYQVYEETYAMAPIFLWQIPRPQPIYHHQFISEFQKRELGMYTCRHSILCFLSAKKRGLWELWNFYYGPIFMVPLLAMLPVMVPWTLRNRWALFALLTCSLLIAHLLTTTWEEVYYASPIAGITFVFSLQAMRLWRCRDRIVGQFVVMVVVFLSVSSLRQSFYAPFKEENLSKWPQQRARILKQLKKEEGQHLIIVRYGPRHDLSQEWVYNGADIDGAKVVWAHDMDKAQNHELVQYFRNRHVWLLETDQDDSVPKLKPYSMNQ